MPMKLMEGTAEEIANEFNEWEAENSANGRVLVIGAIVFEPSVTETIEDESSGQVVVGWQLFVLYQSVSQSMVAAPMIGPNIQLHRGT